MYCQKKKCNNFMYETALNQSAYSQTNIWLSKYIALRSKVVHAVQDSKEIFRKASISLQTKTNVIMWR